jgi:endonuclease YncB( thermonuclease family)
VLETAIGGLPVTCRRVDTDRWYRAVAVCAIDYRHFSAGAYAGPEAAARAAGRGIWAGTFEGSREWRQAHPRVGQ